MSQLPVKSIFEADGNREMDLLPSELFAKHEENVWAIFAYHSWAALIDLGREGSSLPRCRYY